MGILQRIALVYLAVSLLLLHTRWRVQALVAGALLLIYWGLMSLPGFELQPGKDLGAFIDRAVLGESHLWRTWDPESLLGTLPAIATGLIGALTGHWLRSERNGRRKLTGLLLGGGLGIIIGAAWGLVFPLNKYLWTSSYVIYTAGLALLFLAFWYCSSYVVYTAGFALVFLAFWYWLIDLQHAKAVWTQPAIWLGMNPLLAYCGSQIMFIALHTLYIGTPPQHTHLINLIRNAIFGVDWDVIGQTSWQDPQWAALGWAFLCLTFWTLVTGWFYRQRIFLKV